MFKLSGTIVLLTMSFFISGCGKPENPVIETQDQLLQKTIERNLSAIGLSEMPQWQFDADAVATIYQTDGRLLVAQKHYFALDSGDVDLAINSSKEKLITEKLFGDKLSLNGSICSDNSDICSAARLKLYSVAISSLIPLLDDKKLELQYINKECKGGITCDILEIKGNILACCHRKLSKNMTQPDTIRVWFDCKTGYIRRVWMQYLQDEQTGQYGYISAFVSNYTRQINDLIMPCSIEYVPSDSQAGESGKTIFRIDFERFKFQNNSPAIDKNNKHLS